MKHLGPYMLASSVLIFCAAVLLHLSPRSASADSPKDLRVRVLRAEAIELVSKEGKSLGVWRVDGRGLVRLGGPTTRLEGRAVRVVGPQGQVRALLGPDLEKGEAFLDLHAFGASNSKYAYTRLGCGELRLHHPHVPRASIHLRVAPPRVEGDPEASVRLRGLGEVRAESAWGKVGVRIDSRGSITVKDRKRARSITPVKID